MNMQSAERADVIIVGGGIAGTHAASRIIAAGRRPLIVEPTGSHQFLTRLAAVAGGTQSLDDDRVRLDVLFDAPVIEGRAVAADDGSVTLDDGRVLRAGAVILTAGAEPSEAPLAGIDRALPLRSADDARNVRKALVTSDSVVIIGGGPTGCQLAGAIACARPDLDVTLVESGDRLMSVFGERLGQHTAAILRGRGVDVRLGAHVDGIDASCVELADGTRIDAATTVWAGGYTATMQAFGDTIDGRLRIDRFGRVCGAERLFTAGDAAAHVDGPTDPLDAEAEELFAMSAQVAAQAGRQVATNALAAIDGESLRSVKLKDRGWVVDLGGGVGVAELLGVRVATAPFDRVVPALHLAIDLRNLWQLGGLDFVRRFRPGAGAARLGTIEPLEQATVAPEAA